MRLGADRTLAYFVRSQVFVLGESNIVVFEGLQQESCMLYFEV